jgi:phosphatidylinositol alpha-1,6-mannosyltransferase
MSAHGTYAVPHSIRNPLKFLGSFIKKKIMLMAYKKAVSVVAVSNYTREQILKFSKKNNVTVINNGIDFSRFSKIEKIAHQGKIVLSVGLIKERKGYHISIPAIAEARKVIPDLKYKIIGGIANPIYFEKLKRIVEELNLVGTVEFLQNISDSELLDEYATADLFMLSSVNVKNSFEGFGLVFLEAAAAGLPVIGTKNNGIEDAVSNGYNGILVSQNNVKEAADAIIKILANVDLANKFSENGKEWASEKDWDRVVEKYKEMYQNVL